MISILNFLFFASAVFAQTERVILISFDGLGSNVYRQSDMPNLESIKKRGVFSLNAKTVYPSITLVAHMSMLTGLLPEHHHVDWNDWQPQKADLAVKTVFDVARSKGFITAMVAGKDKFRHFQKSVAHFALGENSSSVVGRAIQILKEQKPRLMFLHFAEIDAAGHKHGWLSSEQRNAARTADESLGKLIVYLRGANEEKTTTLIISSDHGGHEKSHGSDRPEDMTIPWIAAGFKIPSSGEISKPIQTTDTAATVLWLLNLPPPEQFDGRSVLPL